ncbi:MAG: DUF6438 domain-containing protein [Blastocatellales bacterium]
MLILFISCKNTPEHVPNQQQSPPPAKIGEITEITLERSICHGECPAYKVTFRSNGSATYTGGAYSQFIGVYEADSESCPECHFGQLREWLKIQKFFDLQDAYHENLIDDSRIKVTIIYNDKKKTVVSNDSRDPIELWGVAMAIDGVVSKIKWKKSASTPNSMKK